MAEPTPHLSASVIISLPFSPPLISVPLASPSHSPKRPAHHPVQVGEEGISLGSWRPPWGLTSNVSQSGLRIFIPKSRPRPGHLSLTQAAPQPIHFGLLSPSPTGPLLPSHGPRLGPALSSLLRSQPHSNPPSHGSQRKCQNLVIPLSRSKPFHGARVPSRRVQPPDRGNKSGWPGA